MRHQAEVLRTVAHNLSGLLLGRLEGEDIARSCIGEGWSLTLRGLDGSLLRVDLHEDHQAQDEQPAFGGALLGRGQIFAHFGGVHDAGVPLARARRGSAGRERRLLRLRDPLESEDLRLGVARHHRSEMTLRLRLEERVCREREDQAV